MFMKKPRNRVFDYTPRFYNPETDRKEKTKRKLGFVRKAHYNRKKRSPIIWLVFIIAVIYLILRFARV